MKGKVALMIIDVQRDFCPGGALAVRDGDSVVEPINRLIRVFVSYGLPVVFSRDWHPQNHCSFTGHGGSWPAHCVKNTSGAAFHQSLEIPRSALVVSKATNPKEEAYSAFQGTGLARNLARLGVMELCVGGLATDYCVKNSVLDAIRNGFRVIVLTDCVKGVNLRRTDSANAFRKMAAEGAETMTSRQLLRIIGRRVAVSSSS